MHNSPYETKMNAHESASSIKDFINCPVQAAYRRYYVNSPKPPESIAMVFGKAIHKMVERMGKTIWFNKLKKLEVVESSRGWTLYGVNFVKGVLDGLHSADGESFAPQPIRWISKARREKLTPEEYTQLIEDEKAKHLGRAHIALEAFRQEVVQPDDFYRCRFELKFTGRRILLTLGEWFEGLVPSVLVNGVVDRLQMRRDRGYVVADYKTGWIVDKLKDRLKRILDHQMTIYHLALAKMYGQPPEIMYFQPLEISKQKLTDLGPRALAEERVYIKPRTDTHLEELAMLAADVHQVITMVVHPEKFSRGEREGYIPVSPLGRMLEFEKNIREGRFVPNIDKHECLSCEFLDVCQDDHRADWIAYKAFRSRDFSKPLPDVPAIAVKVEEVQQDQVERRGQLQLITQGIRAKSKHEQRPKKELKARLLATGNFVHRRSIKGGLATKALAMLDLQGSCPCRKLNLIPVVLSNAIAELPKGAGASRVKYWASQCPHEGCPRRNKKEQIG
jgi:RecB family exonuclease